MGNNHHTNNPDSVFLKKKIIPSNPLHPNIPYSKAELEGLSTKKNKKPSNISPFFTTIDMNNTTPEDIIACNPPKKAYVFGIKWRF